MTRFIITCLAAASTLAHAADTYVANPGDFAPPDPSPGQTVTWKPNTSGAVSDLIFGFQAFSTISDASSAALAGDTVYIAAGIYKQGSEIVDSQGVNFVGDGPGLTILDGDSNHPLFELYSSTTISNLTILNGLGDLVEGIISAGGISYFGLDLTLRNIHFDGNSTDLGIGALYIQHPGSPNQEFLNQVVTIEGCLFSNNTNTSSPAGASCILHEGASSGQGSSDLIITNTTFSSNQGIAIDSLDGTLGLTHCTFYNNQVGAFFSFDSELGPGSSISLNNSIVLDNFGGSNITSNGTNFLAGGPVTEGDGDLFYTDGGATLPEDVIDIVLSNNGGATATHKLSANSVAINAGTNSDAVDAFNNPLTFDQRGPGFPRISQGIVDIGAFEIPNLTLSIADVSISEDGGSTTVTVSRNNDPSRELVVSLLTDDPTQATIPATLIIPAGAISSTTILTAVDDAMIDGNQIIGEQVVTISASASGFADSSAQLEVRNDDFPIQTFVANPEDFSPSDPKLTDPVTWKPGNADAVNGLTFGVNAFTSIADATSVTAAGGTISIAEGSYTEGSEIYVPKPLNFHGDGPGLTILDGELNHPLFALDSPATIKDLTIQNGSSQFSAGGITSYGSELNLSNISFLNNSSKFGCGALEILNFGGVGALDDSGPTTQALGTGYAFRIDDCLFSGNTSTDGDSSCIYHEDDAFGFGSSHLIIANTTFSSNDHLAIWSLAGTLSLTQCTFYNNPSGAFSALEGEGGPASSVLLNNSLILDSFNANNITSNGTNFLADGPIAAGDLFFTNGGPTVPEDLIDIVLSDNGGATATHKLSTNSVAINAGKNADAVDSFGNPLTFDQRGPGFPRILQGTVDIGAFELFVPTLTLSIADSSISENGGSSIITVTRNTDTTSALIINLSSDDPSEATVPLTLTIPAGDFTAITTLTAVDDLIVDGPQTVTISATVDGFIGGSGQLNVTDDDVPTLVLSIADASISENGGSSIVTVTRNTDPSSELIVDLSSDDPSEAILPATLTIPAGDFSASTTLTAVDDAIVDGPQTVTITATVDGFIGDSGQLNVTDDDVPTLILSIADASIPENGGSSIVTVTRNTDPSSELIVDLSSDDPSEAILPATLTIPAGDFTAITTLTAVDDLIVDGPQTVTISATVDGFIGGSGQLNVTDDDVPTLILSIADASISENGGSSIVTVARNTDTTSALIINLSSDDPSEATVPLTLTIPAGDFTAITTLTAVDDFIVDGPQTVTISATVDGFIGGSGQLNVTDNDVPTLILSISDASISENGGSSIVTVARNTDPSSELIVDLSIDDPSEAILPATLTIPAGNFSAITTLSAADDLIVDGPQTVTISATVDGFIGGSGQLNVTDDDVPTLILSIADASISENGGSSIVTVTRNTDPSSELIVDLSSDDPSEAILPATLTIPAGDFSASTTLTAVDDAIVDGPQTVTITATVDGFIGDSGQLNVTDDDVPTLILSIADASISENGGSSIVTVTRNTDPSSELIVDLSSDDPSEAILPATLTIPAGDFSAITTLSAADDLIADGPQTVTISATVDGFIGGSGQLNVTDDDVPTLILSIADASISENGGSSIVTVARNTDTTSALIVNLSSDDPSEAILPATLTIPAGDFSAITTLSAADDLIVDGPQTVTISATVDGFIGGSGQLNVTDDDVPTLILSIADASISENGGSSIVTVARNTDTTSALIINLSSDDPSEATVPLTLTIPAGDFTATVTLTTVDDLIVDGPQTVTISATVEGFIGDSGQLNVTDNDVPTLTLSIADASISENGGSSIVTVTRNTDTTSALIVNLSSDDPSEATVPATLTLPALASSAIGSLTAIDDSIFDGTQIVTISATAPGFTGDSNQLDITDDDPLRITLEGSGTLSEPDSFSNSPLSPSETNLFLRRNGTLGDVAVNIGIDPNSLSEIGNDFTINGATSSTFQVTIPDGQSNLALRVQVIDDGAAEVDETFVVRLLPGAFVSENTSTSITIAQNDYGVTSFEDFDSSIAPDQGEGTLRQAIINAKANLTLTDAPPSEPVINFHPDMIGEINLVAGPFLLDQASFSIIGPGSRQLTISGRGTSRIFLVSDPAQDLAYTISGLTLTEGFSATNGGAIFSTEALILSDCICSECAANIGGAVSNEGNLELKNCMLFSNSAVTYGGAIDNFSGTLSLINCTLSENQAVFGGGIENVSGGELWVDASTFYRNTAEASGGAIDSFGAIANLSNTTISGNEAGFGGGLFNEGSTMSIWQSTIVENIALASVGGILTSAAAPASTTLYNTIVAGNTESGSPSDLSTNNASFVDVNQSSSNNLIGHVFSAGGLSNGTNGNIVGIAASNEFGPLADHGGPTATHALLPGSLAINAGNPAFALNSESLSLTTDQRGFPRFVFGANDIGAFEVSETPISIVSLDVTPGTSVTITWVSEDGVSYDVLRSTDLRTWETIANGIISVSDLTSWTDDDLPVDRAFYTVRPSAAE